MNTASIVKAHREAVAHAARVTAKLRSVNETTGGMVKVGASALLSGVGAGTAAVIDHYGGKSTDPIPEAMIGPIPVVATAAFGGTLLSLAAVRTDWAWVLAGFSNGLGSGAAYGMTARLLKAHAGT